MTVRGVCLLVLFVSILANTAFASVLTVEYSFPEPIITTADGLTRITMDGSWSVGDPGEPVLPRFGAKILLPPGEKISRVELIPGKITILDGQWSVEPGQKQYPLSFKDEVTPDLPSEKTYSSENKFPVKYFNEPNSGFYKGYHIATVAIHPVEYRPALGQISYIENCKLQVFTEPDFKSDSQTKAMISHSPATEKQLPGMIDNPEIIRDYDSINRTSSSRALNPTDAYKYLIITSDAYSYYLDEFTDFQTNRGLKAGVFVKNWINSEYSGIDEQERIRNFIIDAYSVWDIEYVLLVGDSGPADGIPHRGMYASAYGSTESNLPSDLYYGCLDGNWNDDNDSYWGEFGEADLYHEVGVGRAAVSSPTELQAWVTKQMRYQLNPVDSECSEALMCGELLWTDPTWGADYKDEIRLGASTWGYTTEGLDSHMNVSTLYDKDSTWNPNTLLDIMSGGLNIINHLGHCDYSYMMKFYNGDIPQLTNDGLNHSYNFVYSQGCMCGGFDHDSISENLNNDEHGPVALVTNSRYGWGQHQSTNGSSQYFDREFFDAMVSEEIYPLSNMNDDSKMDVIWNLEYGANRWCFYELNLFGDPAMQLWTDTPGDLTVNHPNVLFVDEPEIEIIVSNSGVPVNNARVCAYTEDYAIYSSGVTDASGYVTLSTNTTTPGELFIKVVSHNTHEFTSMVPVEIPSGPYVVYQTNSVNDAVTGNNNGVIDYGEDILLTLAIENVGTENAVDVNVVIDSPSSFITITDNNENFGTILPDDIATAVDGYAFSVSDNIPDGHTIYFDVIATDALDSTFVSHFSVVAHAPVLEMMNFVVNDGDNGFLDPGETADIEITLNNNGSSALSELTCALTSADSYITIISGEAIIPEIAPGDNGLVVFTVSTDPLTPIGHTVNLQLDANSSNYSFTHNLNLSVGLSIEDFETNSFYAYPWTMDGNTDWIIETADTYEGVYSARSGEIDDGEESILSVSVEVISVSDISFAYKVSSESGYDLLNFYIDGVLQDNWSGTTQWATATYPVTIGNHNFTWAYRKDGSSNNGSDCGWIDYIIFPTISALPSSDISIDPSSFSENILPGDITTRTLTVANSGPGELVFDIAEHPAQDWINVNPASGSIAADQTIELTVTLDATTLCGGIYSTDLEINNNDPSQYLLTVPVQMSVPGTDPSIVVEPLEIDFGSLFVGDTVCDSIMISNNGCDVLAISEITSVQEEFIISPTSFDLNPEETQLVNIYFTPTESVDIQDTLRILSNDPEEPITTVLLSGEGVDPPIVTVTPDSLYSALSIGDVETQTITINNSGGSNLEWEINKDIIIGKSYTLLGEAAKKAIQEITRTGSIQLDGKTVPAFTADESRLFKSRLDEYKATIATLKFRNLPIVGVSGYYSLGLIYDLMASPELPELFAFIEIVDFQYDDLSALDGLIISESDLSITETKAQVLRDFYDSGRPIIFGMDDLSANWSGQVPTLIGPVFGITDPYDADLCGETILNTDHPICNGIESFYDDGLWCNDNDAFMLDGAEWLIRDATNNGLFVLANNGVARTIIMGETLYGIWDENLQFNVNAVKWAIESTYWLTVEPEIGTVVAGGSQTVDITFDANKMLGGDYLADLIITSNDPITPELITATHLNVTGVPNIILSDTELDFGPLVIGYTASDALVISNNGTDSLFVTSISSNNAIFTSDLSTFTIYPGNSQQVVVTFAPTNIGVVSGVLSIKSNDPKEPVQTVALSGECLNPPIATVTPDSLYSALNTGETETHIINIDNSGGSDLEWEIAFETDGLDVFDIGNNNNKLKRMPFNGIFNSDNSQSIIQLNKIRHALSDSNVIFYDDMESGINGWTTEVYGVDDLWHQVESNYNSPSHSFWCGVDGQDNYETGNRIITAIVSPTISLAGVDSIASLQFFENYYTESGWDYCMVDVTIDNGASWIPLKPGYSGNSNGWINTTLDLTPYCGNQIKIRFYFDSTDYQYNDFPGWFLDDIVVYSSQPVIAWLWTDSISGTIPVGSSQDVQLTFDAAGLSSGDYLANLIVSSNDQITPEIYVSTHLNVSGAPDIILSENNFDFGPVYLSVFAADTILVSNIGADSLVVSNINSNLSDFATDQSAFTIYPGDSQQIIVTFAPITTGLKTGKLSIMSNDPDEPILTVFLSGEGVDPPIVTVKPDSLYSALSIGDIETQTITIDNSGGSDLEWKINTATISGNSNALLGEAAKKAIQGITRTGSMQLDGKTVPAFTADESRLFKSRLDEYNATVAVLKLRDLPIIGVSGYSSSNFIYNLMASPELPELFAFIEILDFQYDDLSALDGLIISEYDHEITEAKAHVLRDFYDSGRPIIFGMDDLSANWSGQVPTLIGPVFGITDPYDANLCGETILNTDHPICDGIESFYDDGFWCDDNDAFMLDGAEWLIRGATNNGLFVLANSGVARTVIMGETLYGIWDENLQFNVNAVKWAMKGAYWLTAEPEIGTIVAGGSQTVDITFDATDTPIGNHLANLVFISNDPITPELITATHLNVIGVPNITLSDSEFDFGSIIVGCSASDTFFVSNTGTDSLIVYAIISDHSDFSTDQSSFIIYPDNSQQVIITFDPINAGTKTGTLVIKSNDQDEPTLTVTLSGEALDAPIITIAPDSLYSDLNTGEVDIQTLAIENSGGSDLEWAIRTEIVNIKSCPTLGKAAAKAIKGITRTGSMQHDGQMVPDFTFDEEKLFQSRLAEYRATISSLKDIDLYLVGVSGYHSTQLISRLLASPELSELYAFIDIDYETDDLSALGGLAIAEYDHGITEPKAQVLRDFYDSGRPIIFSMDDLDQNWGGQVPALIGPVFGITDPYDAALCFDAILNSDHPICEGIESFDPAGGWCSDNDAFMLDGAEWLVQDADNRLFVLANEGTARTVIMGEALYGIWNENLQFNINVFKWAMRSAYWLSAEPKTGTLVAGDSQVIDVTFDATGMFSREYCANLTVVSNDPITPKFHVATTLNITSTPDISLSNTEFDFGPQFVGLSFTDTILVSNIGADSLRVYDIGSDSDYFTTSLSEFTINYGVTQPVILTYSADSLGTHTGTITFTSNDPDESILAVNVSGSGISPPVIAVSPDSLYSESETGGIAIKSITIENSAGSDLEWEASSVETAKTSWISCSPSSGTLTSGNFRTVEVIFDASELSQGNYNADIVISSNDPLTPEVVVATLFDVHGNPDIDLSTTAFDYGIQIVGEPATESLLIRNLGTDPLVISNISSDHDAFFADPSSLTIDAGNYLFVNVVFNPIEFGLSSGILTITSNDPDEPVLTASLFGIAINPPLIEVSPNSLDCELFADSSEIQTIVIGNIGDSDLQWWLDFNEPSSKAPLKNDKGAKEITWLSADLDSGIIQPTQSQNIQITFNSAGMIAGNYSAHLHFTSNDPTTPALNVPVNLFVQDNILATVDITLGELTDIGNEFGVTSESTDGYDIDIDLPEPQPSPTNYLCAYFPHPEWGLPIGDKFQTDFRETINPESELKRWPFVVDTDQTGSVTLSFVTEIAEGVEFWLRDEAVGVVYNLIPSLNYTYEHSVAGQRSFEIVIGKNVPSMLPESRELNSGLTIVGLPLVPPEGSESLGDVLLDDIISETHIYNYENSGYLELETDHSLIQGQGLWVNTETDFVWTMEGEKDEDGVAIPLSNGWSLVGYPLWLNGGLDRVAIDYQDNRISYLTAVNEGLVSGAIFDYDPNTDSYFATNSLEPWHGYWFAALEDSVSLWFDYRNLEHETGNNKTYPATEGWLVSVTMDQGAESLTYGTSESATTGFDSALDMPIPPCPPSEIPKPTMRFVHPEWNISTGEYFSSDIIPTTEGGAQWSAWLTIPEPGQITIRWDSSNIPVDSDNQIYLPSENRVIVTSMKEQDFITLTVGSEPLEIRFQTPDFISSIPDAEYLGLMLHNAPNPFNPGTEFKFNLRSSGATEIRIYNIRGAVVRNIYGGQVNAGVGTLYWNGRDGSGSNVSSGTYFYRLYVNGKQEGSSKKMSLVK
jgi:hypothetical protein